jgi:hypothetical protein
MNPKVNIIAFASWCAGLMIDHKINKNRAKAADRIASGDYLVKGLYISKLNFNFVFLSKTW